MRILAIESSCDETSVAVVEDGTTVLSNIIASSKDVFERAGGVIPEYAARKQLECMVPVIKDALSGSKMKRDDIDAIAVTYGPGLLGSLLVGTTTARVLAHIWNKPLIPVHHHQGHLDSIWLESADQIAFPVLTLSVSGGHTELWLRQSHVKGLKLGMTKDDAAGEAFDKGALMLGLPYPGGPALSKLGDGGNESAFLFPRPLAQEESFDFSFSGLKTALKYTLRDLGEISEHQKKDLAASFQNAICMHLTERVVRAESAHPEIKEVHVVGGVSANSRLRAMLSDKLNSPVMWPVALKYCTDNAAMIGAAAYFQEQEHATLKEWTTSPTTHMH